MRLPGSLREWSFVVAALAFGCTPSIGDACKLHTDCSATGDRLCEPNLPGGYCTIFNCEPGSCPDEAACVAFGITPSSKLQCGNEQSQRLERTFCMKTCTNPSDCRGGYSCVDPKTEHWEAAILDRGSKVCTVDLTQTAKEATMQGLDANGASAEVCTPQPPFPPLPDASSASRDASHPAADARPATDGPAALRRDASPLADAGVPTPDAGLGAPDARGTP